MVYTFVGYFHFPIPFCTWSHDPHFPTSIANLTQTQSSSCDRNNTRTHNKQFHFRFQWSDRIEWSEAFHCRCILCLRHVCFVCKFLGRFCNIDFFFLLFHVLVALVNAAESCMIYQHWISLCYSILSLFRYPFVSYG